jgi:hypothetical protein
MKNETQEVNIFTYYKQKENQFTNGLISLLKLGSVKDKTLSSRFFLQTMNVNIQDEFVYKVLKDYDFKSYADAILLGNSWIICFETKIKSGSFDDAQIARHLLSLDSCSDKYPGMRKLLVLLSPDDSNSNYIKNKIKLSDCIIHLEWEKVYRFFVDYIRNFADDNDVFCVLINQYISTIKHTIFMQDIVGIIAKIDFGDKSGVYPNKYIEEMRAGMWDRWNTPREYKNLSGTGRKLLLYDKTLKSITLEVEIDKVEGPHEDNEYPYTNLFVPDSINIFTPSVNIDKIEKICGLEKFSHIRAPYMNITSEQYTAMFSNQN